MSVQGAAIPAAGHTATGTEAAAQQTPIQQAPAQHRNAGVPAANAHATPATQAPATQTPAAQIAGLSAANPSATGSLPVDSLAINSLAAGSLDVDSLAVGTMAGDSLPFFSLEMPLAQVDADSPWRDAPAEAVFGAASVPAEPERLQGMQAPSLTGNPVFQSFVLVLAVTYAMLLYRNLGDMRLLLTRVSRDRATGERLTEDPGGSGFSRFLNIATTIGMFFTGVMAVKYGDSLMPDYLIETLPQSAGMALCLLATAAFTGVVLFQLAAVRLAGAVTLAQPFVTQLVLLKRTYFTLGVIVTSPFLLLFALCPRGTGGVWFCVIVIELVVTVILYLKEVLNLFISKKVSILHWILYLCTVEIFPFSLLWLLAAR